MFRSEYCAHAISEVLLLLRLYNMILNMPFQGILGLQFVRKYFPGGGLVLPFYAVLIQKGKGVVTSGSQPEVRDSM